eukprot:6190235-Pleurochrysis_carterae.AAC.2
MDGWARAAYECVIARRITRRASRARPASFVKDYCLLNSFDNARSICKRRVYRANGVADVGNCRPRMFGKCGEPAQDQRVANLPSGKVWACAYKQLCKHAHNAVHSNFKRGPARTHVFLPLGTPLEFEARRRAHAIATYMPGSALKASAGIMRCALKVL